MRIVLTIHHPLDRNSGSPGTTIALAEAYRRAGHETELLSFDDLPSSFGVQARMLAFPALVARRLAGPLGRWCDVVDSASGDAWLWSVLRRNARAPSRRPLLVTRSHGLEHLEHLEHLRDHREGRVPLRRRYHLYHGSERLRQVAVSFRRADLALFLNQADLDHAVKQLGVDGERAHIVRNGIDDSLLGLPAPQPGDTSGEVKIALIARHTHGMGIAYSVPAIEQILSRHPGARATLLGGGVAEDAVRADFTSAVRGRIDVVPSFENTDLPQLLDGHEILLSAKFAEGFGKALVEGMACGLAPVVVAASGPATILSDGETGLLVGPRDAAALADGVERLLEDPGLRLRLRRNAHAAAQQYSWDAAVAERIALLEAAIAVRSGRRPTLQAAHDATGEPRPATAHGTSQTPPDRALAPDAGHKKVA